MTSIRFASAFILLAAGLVASAQGPVRPVPTGSGRAYPSGTGGPSFTPATPGKLPDGARRRLGSDLFREPNYISAASISPDGKTLAVCGGSQIIRFLDIATGKELRRITIREYLRTNQIIWMPDGKQIVTTGYNGINIWDTSDGKLVKQATNPNKDGRDGMIHMSADGKFVAIGNQYENGSIKIVDLSTGNQLGTVKPIQNSTVQGALSPKGEIVATWGQHYNRGNGKPEDEALIPRTIQLWDAKEAKEKASLLSDIYQIMCVRFSPDGAKVAAGGNGVIQLWDVASGKLERRFAGRTGQGMQLVFSNDGKFLSAAGQDGCVQSWEVASGKRAGICDGPIAAVAGMLYTPSGQLLAWAINVNAIEIWEVPSGKRLTPQGGHTAPVTAVQFSQDDKTLISCGNDGKMLRWEVATGKEMEPFDLKESEAKKKMYGYPRGYMGPSHFSPNGKYLVASGANGGGAAVWDVDAGLELFALTNGTAYVDRSGIICFSGDSGKLMAMNRYNGREQAFPIPVWDMETGLPMPAIKGQKGDFTSAGFSTDGSILTTCAYFYPPNGNQIAEAWSWELATGKTLSRVQIPNTQFQATQFLDHRLFVAFTSGGVNQSQKIYDAVTGGEVRALEGSTTFSGVATAALSPDRRLLAYGTQRTDRFAPGANISPSQITVWEVASGSIRYELGGLEGTVTSLVFSRDGKSLASGSSDTTILLWDLGAKPQKADPLKPGDLDEMWQDLEKPNARKGEEILRKMTARPTESLPFLKEQLKPVVGLKADPVKISKMIDDLDSPRYAVREAAMRDLEKLGGHAREAVAQALKKANLTPEVRERLEKLTEKINKPDSGAEWIRALRGVELLERIGNADAIAQLKELAAGGDAPPTRVARESLGRLGVK
jgi:WD40 repeat protein